MRVSVTAAKERITCIGCVSRQRDAGIVHAFRVLRTTDRLRTFVRAIPDCRQALIPRACEMRPIVTATEERIAVALTAANNRDARISLTLRMLGAFDGIGAIIGADSWQCDALAVLTFVVLRRTASQEDLTLVGAAARNGHAGFSLAFGVLLTPDRRDTCIGPAATHRHALCPLALRVLPLGATEGRITGISTGTGECETGVPQAFRMCIAVHKRRAFIGTPAFVYKTDSPGIIADEVLLAAIFIVDAFIGAAAGKPNARIARTRKMRALAATEIGITEVFAGVGAGHRHAERPLADGVLDALDVILACVDARSHFQ